MYGCSGRANSSAAVRELDDLPEVHDRDPVGDVADDGEVVGDEEVGEPELLLQLDEQVQHLRLDRDVERRHRLVGDDELRLQDERAGDPDALALAAAELVRVAAQASRAPSPTRSSTSTTRSAPLLRAATPWIARPSPTMSPTRIRGSSEPTESWKMICMSRRAVLQLRPRDADQVDARRRRSRPRSARSARISVRPSVDLPQPDSPTSPSVSPRADLEVDAVDGLDVADRPPQQALLDREVLPDPARLEQDVADVSRVACGVMPSRRLRCPSRARGGRARRASTPTACSPTSKSGGCSVAQRSKA